MIEDLLVGMFIGVIAGVILWPWTGVFWYIRQLQKKVQLLTGQKPLHQSEQ